MFDFTAARKLMIDGQLRPNGITSDRILDAMEAVPREHFLPDDLKFAAYADEDLPLGHGRVLLAPMTFARLLQIAAIDQGQHVLVVGAATGYGSAVISKLARTVTALECDSILARKLNSNMAEFPNVRPVEGQLTDGVPADAPFDVIIFAGRIAVLPEAICNQVLPEGRIIAAFGPNSACRLSSWQRRDINLVRRDGFEATTSILPGFSVAEPAFVFA